MRLGLVSNWGSTCCGVAQFGRNWLDALVRAGHSVLYLAWGDWTAPVDRILINWDSGTLPHGPVPDGSLVYIHHWYRGQPANLDRAIVCSPVSSQVPPERYLPYPVPDWPAQVQEYAERRMPVPRPAVVPRTLGVTTLRGQGVDYLQQACAQIGWTLCAPTQWRETREEVLRLAACAVVALYYSDSPGRSLALATSLAARRPLLLSRCSQMFAFAWENPQVYWVDFAHDPAPIVARLPQIAAAGDQAGIPDDAGWHWPQFVARLEALWA